MAKVRVILCVFNNLQTDQRIEKICGTLHQNGYEVQLIGCSWDGLPEISRPYEVRRIVLRSKTLKLAYLEFNLKVYRLLKEMADKKTIIVANDLDTLAAGYKAAKKLKIPLIYDSHEIFTEMPSVQGRFVQKIWRRLEAKYIGSVKYMMTASRSYADWFEERYQRAKPTVIQNFPLFQEDQHSPENTHPKIIIYQGVINPSRGLDKIIPCMQKIKDAELWIAGKGPKYEEYRQLTQTLHLEDKVKFLGKLKPETLRAITQKADVGLSIEENNGLSYFYSLPNKVSDYIQARVPVVVSNFPEMKRIVETYRVGATIANHSQNEMITTLETVLNNGKSHYLENLNIAASKLNWEHEEPKLLALYAKVCEENF